MKILAIILLFLTISCNKNENSNKTNEIKISEDTTKIEPEDSSSLKVDSIKDTLKNEIANYGYENVDYSNAPKVIPEDSLNGLVLYYPGLTVNFPNVNYNCSYNSDSLVWLDTFNIGWSDAFGCGYGDYDTINIYKSENVRLVDLFHQGTKAYFFNDDGSGGVWTDDRIEIISSEVEDIYSQTDTIYTVDDIFKLEFPWKKNFEYEHSEIADKIVAEQEYRTSMILPHSYNFIFEWSVEHADDGEVEKFKKVVRIEFIHGD